jgi:hypothetical protein
MPLPLMELPLAPDVIGEPPRSLNQEVGFWTVSTSTSGDSQMGVLALTTVERHGFRAATALALQNRATQPPTTRGFYPLSVSHRSQSLAGIAYEGPPLEVLDRGAVVPPESRRRYALGIAGKTSDFPAGVVVQADSVLGTRDGTVVRTGTVGGRSYVEVDFSGSAAGLPFTQEFMDGVSVLRRDSVFEGVSLWQEPMTRWAFRIAGGNPALVDGAQVVLLDTASSQSAVARVLSARSLTVGSAALLSGLEVEFDTLALRDTVTNATRVLIGWQSDAGAFQDWQLAYEPVGTSIGDPALEDAYRSFTLQDRKGNIWVYRGPHRDSEKPSMAMQFYYRTLPGFFFPTLALEDQPPVGTITPYLRSVESDGSYAGDPVYGNAVDPSRGDGNAFQVVYHPIWPASAPVLQMAETLTLPKRGLPAVRGQTSLEIVYQQSQARSGRAAESVVLHDPTREKEYALGAAGGADRLGGIPDSVRTESYRGMTYFPNLPPHLSERFFLDPNRGTYGKLVFRGEFKDEALGDDYVLLNLLGDRDVAYLKELCLGDDPNKSAWDSAVDGLTTRLELFVENPAKPGTYVPSSSVPVGPTELSRVNDDDVAVDSYALTATGPGTGYVTLIAGNGLAFTPAAEPVSVQVLRVADSLYRGELKIVASSNPLSETLTLQQVVDLAGRAEDYHFEWKIASPVDGLNPPVYETHRVPFLLDGTWNHLRFPVSTDRAGTVASISSDRWVADVTTSVPAVSRVPFLAPTGRDGDQFRFSIAPGSGPRLLTGTALVLRDADGVEFQGTLHGLSSATELVVQVDPGQGDVPASFVVNELYERASEGQPQSLVFREFSVPPGAVYSEVWLSLELNPALGARVYLDGQPMVVANVGAEDTAKAPPPALSRPWRRLTGSKRPPSREGWFRRMVR